MERWIKDWFDKNFHDRLRNAIRDGGHTQLSGTTRCLGNFHGARTVLQYVAKKTDAQSRWLQDLIARRGYNRASVALANKNARIIQALLSSGRAYELAAAP